MGFHEGGALAKVDFILVLGWVAPTGVESASNFFLSNKFFN